MPRIAKDYSKTVMYKIRCNDSTIILIYVGHTTNFLRRRRMHKQACNDPTNTAHNLKIYKTIRENGGWDNWEMIQIESYPCNNNFEATLRERHYYELLKATLNANYPGRTIKEYKIVKNTCSCGGKHTNHHKYEHVRSKKHVKYIVSLELTDVVNQYINTD